MKLNSITSFKLNKGHSQMINKTLLGFLGAAGFSAMAATGAMAQQATFASATGTGPIANQSTVFTYSGGANGVFRTTGGALFNASSFPNANTATLTFTGFGASGMATGNGSISDPFKQILSGGTFSLKDSTSGADLLDGTFSGGNLLSAIANSSSTASITETANGVTYTGGSYFADSGLFNPGAFSISMTSVAPAPTITNGYLDAFQAGGTSTFSASTTPAAVPEAGTIVPFAIGGFGLLALVVRKNRRASSVTA